mmetsp:Transcript_35851/g.79829  ORF Transcript_35851/g.79829 Transcript_35851/m.79829 type:complete len:183 (+) Transcript_35851:90-638(+)|eukprot:CAMPEP_0202895796 /NCGR_PEP_ID=MMETSP1392-20130828/4932_1 /ASSEMBLY_ACC=CAM_ASM_000868 /TAXON_ID=225041 /ORGANISM="Chlamydomonas chlamydogama, Strain SAG 11-48b" /LENGTH=182 /DNA_ID=CAMNT_0049580933 /DNA_START=19 /DNA_END=567 /DNA_ORIENTATION=+
MAIAMHRTSVRTSAAGNRVSLDRRGLLFAGVASTAFLRSGRRAVASPNFVLDLPACTTYNKSKSGVQWCDVRAGDGEEPLPGDLIACDFTARAVATGNVYDGSRNFKFGLGNSEILPAWESAIVGDGDIPAIKKGGIRTIVIPSELAYGKLGDQCLYGLSTACRVPPDSPVEITFAFKGVLF